MKIFTDLSSLDIYDINFAIIKSFSFLLPNLKNKMSLYYFFSNNFINKIMSKSYINYDQDFFAYFINLLKSLTLRLNEESLEEFFMNLLNEDN